MAPTDTITSVTPEQLDNLPSSFRYELARTEGDIHTTGPFASLIRPDLDRELEAIQRAPDAVAAHELARQIRSHLNQLSFVYRLPTEIISAIFHLVVQTDMRRSWPVRHATRISIVSRLWRDIATQSCATLWTKISWPVLPISLLELCLSRSRSAPLDIVLHSAIVRRKADILRFLELVVPHIHRWRDFRVIYYDSRVQDILSFLQEASAPAPLLEVLQFNFGPMYDPPRVPLQFLQPFCGITPRLRTINSNVYIPMSSPVYRGLTELHLYYINYPEPDPIRRLLGILELCPLLKSLCITELVLLATIPTDHVSDPIILLRHLQKLYIAEEWDARWMLSHFLPRIAIPTSCRLDIAANARWGDHLYRLIPQRSNFLLNLPDLQSVRALHMHCPWSRDNTSVCGKILTDDPDAFKFTVVYPDEPHGAAGGRDHLP
ncbi:hypothetical protein BOTBODRAFT_526562 [Botryobasidium botryosum FD-172 SS1]|uniref:F-box domain-containing protein n=1 Tax=Botryobasidium botryosum (strain FD-172 SS1) TaxID=930990 RepID=A0A067M1K8_BOTB1|nr:hypothetical protein BOTBODRAFT_526562 [Botryobasidium botryosum FD-172 SS1]